MEPANTPVGADEPATEPKWQCEHCPKAFTRREHYKRHLLLHSGTRPFACPGCPKTFYRKDMLQRHLPSHGLTRTDGMAASSRIRTSKACHECRSRKTACDGETPCWRCKRGGVTCVYGPLPHVNEESKATAALMEAPSMFGGGGAAERAEGEGEVEIINVDAGSPEPENIQRSAPMGVPGFTPANAPSFTPANAPAADATPSSGYTTARNHFRVLRACQGCAKSKMGCDGQAPCTRCQQRRIPCIQQLPKAVRRRQTGYPNLPTDSQSQMEADALSQPQYQLQPHQSQQAEHPEQRSQQAATYQTAPDLTKTVLAVASSSEQNTSLTTRDVELLLKAYRCMRQEISVDYAKLARLAHLKDSDSAKASWHNLKKKIDGVGKRAVVVKAMTARRSIAQRPQQEPVVSQPAAPSVAESTQEAVPEVNMVGAPS